jgi:hypothetical protein
MEQYTRISNSHRGSNLAAPEAGPLSFDLSLADLLKASGLVVWISLLNDAWSISGGHLHRTVQSTTWVPDNRRWDFAYFDCVGACPRTITRPCR